MNKLNELKKWSSLYEKFDNYFKNLIPDNYVELNMGSLIEKEELKKCGYFEKNPDYILINGSIDNHKIEHVVKNKEVSSQDIDNKTISFLIPAGCLNIYPIFKDQTYVENTCITTRAKVYRRENVYIDGIRLKEFTQREVVFIGDKNYVCSMLAKFEEIIVIFGKKINPEAKSEIATDNFYATPKNRLAKKYQLIKKTKHEIVIPIGENKVACASINYHNMNFSNAFNFSCNNTIVTGCVGFGIERWCSAFIHNGSDYTIFL